MNQPKKKTATAREDPEIDGAEQRVRDTIVALRDYLGLTQSDLARVSGISRQNLDGRLGGAGTKFTIADLHRLAPALKVDLPVLFMDAEDAVRWALDHGIKPGAGRVTPLRRRQPSKPTPPTNGGERAKAPRKRSPGVEGTSRCSSPLPATVDQLVAAA